MDYMPYISNAVRCLAGVIGTEPVNPTCIAWGFPTTGYLTQFLAWAPVVTFVGVIFGVPMVIWLLWKVFDLLGIDL